MVTTLVEPEEESLLNSIAQELQLDMQQQSEPAYAPAPQDDPEQAKRNLEDLYRLL